MRSAPRTGYDAGVAAETFSAWHRGRIVSTILRLLAGRRPETMLDLGCGDGARSIEISRHLSARLVVGLDQDAEALAAARARGLPVVEGFVSDAPALFPGRFDLVHAFGVAEAIPALPALLWAMLGCARPGGLALASYALPTAATEVWLRAARAGGLDVRFHVECPEEVERLVEGLPVSCRLVGQAPIWRLYTTDERLLRLRAPTALWEAADRALGLLRRPPVGMYVLLERR